MTRAPPRATLVFLMILALVGSVSAALIDSTADGPFASGGTNEADYNTIVNDLFGYVGDTGNTTVKELSCSFGACMWIPKYASSTSLDSMNGCGGKTKASYSMSTNFMVTDEFSQVMQLVGMGNNGTRMAKMMNTVRWINSSGAGGSYGPLSEWCVSIDNNVLNMTATSDVASDADARIIDSLYSCSANDNFNSSLRAECYSLAAEMTAEFYAEELLSVNKQHNMDSYNVTLMPCGGGNVCSALTNDGFMYTGYYGDNAIMLLKACKRTGNLSYCGAANNITLSAMMAAGNSSVGYYNGTSLRFPMGVHHNFSNAATPRPFCTNTCTTSGGWWDYADAPRFATLGVYEYQANRIGQSRNSNLTTYLTKWAGESSCISTTSWALEANPSGVCNSRNAGFYETGVGSHLIIHTNNTFFENWIDAALGSSHYNPTTRKWDSTGEFGAYRQSFPIRSLGIGMGLDEDSYTLYTAATTPPSFLMKGDGRDGDLIVNTTGYVVNNYTNLTRNVTSGASTFQLTSCAAFPNGTDLLLMDMSGTHKGRWEQHFRANINASCAVTLQSGDTVGWDTSDRVQIVNIPNFADLTINSTGSITAGTLDATSLTGGVIAFRVSGTLNTTGQITTVSTGFAGGVKGGVSDCNLYGYQGDGYESSGVISESANGVGGGGGENGGICSANAEGGGGGAGQNNSGERGNRYVTTTETSDLGGHAGTPIGETNTSTHLQIGGGGGGGFDWHASCAATNGAAGSGVAVIYADTAINLNLTLEGANGANPGNCNQVGAGGGGGAGSAFLNIRSLTWSQGDARGGGATPLKSPGGSGIIGVRSDSVTGTTDPSYVLIGDYIPGLSPITWAQDVDDYVQVWNTSFYLDLNTTPTSECTLSGYSSSSVHFPINSTGAVSFGANITKVGNYTVTFSATDNCSSTIEQTVNINITYTSPNLTSVLISPSPTGTASPLVCLGTLQNPDGSSFTSNTTRWFKSGILQASLTNATSVGTGNLTISDQWLCEWQGTDTLTTFGATNSSTLVLGDSTAPTINTFSISDTTATISTGTVTYTVNCTDPETIGTIKIEVQEPSQTKTNYTASLSSGNLYTYTYPVPGTAGNYTARAYCTDGSNNVATLGTLNFTATASSGGSSGGGGGGGGGSTTIIQTSTGPLACGFSILQPVNGYLSPLCPKDRQSTSFSIVLYNDQGTEQTYMTNVTKADCTLSETTFTIPPRSSKTITVNSCQCPTGNDDTVEGNIVFKNGACGNTVQVALYTNALARLVNDPGTLGLVGIGLFGLLATIIVGAALAKSL